jgi:hypothetical protein
MRRRILTAALACALDASAATLNPDGTGQALIYPYYTVRSAEGGVFNTYLSVTNHTRFAKAVRVRVRESRLGKEVSSFNIFLSPNDMWTGAIVPTASGAKIISNDVSCTDPDVRTASGSSTREFVFKDTGFTGVNADGAGSGLDRAREGYVEMIEMARLSGASAVAVTHRSTGMPGNCAAVMGAATLDVLEAPTGGLSGSATLIDVERGFHFGIVAHAIDQLASRPYYRPPSDPYPSFAAAEIDPRSTVIHEGHAYHSEWLSGLNAVSAVLSVSELSGEYVLDELSGSRSEVVLTMPTRPLHAFGSAMTPPFTAALRWAWSCTDFAGSSAEFLTLTKFSREEASFAVSGSYFPELPPREGACAVAAVGTLKSIFAPELPPLPPTVLGSVSNGLGGQHIGAFNNGELRIFAAEAGSLTSLQSSRRVELATGAVTQGRHRFEGLPAVGFIVNTYRNGATNFGAAQALRTQRRVRLLP